MGRCNSSSLKPEISRGLIAALALVAFYFLLIGLISRSWQHSLELLAQDRFYVGAIAIGFGAQVGLFSYIRRLRHHIRCRGAGTVMVSGTGTSTVSMVACCLHHVGDFLPVLGVSGAWEPCF